MSRLKSYGGVPSLMGSEPAPHCLKKQSRYGGKPWQPGEIPTRNGTLLVINQPLDAKPAPYGEFYGIEKPTSRGSKQK